MSSEITAAELRDWGSFRAAFANEFDLDVEAVTKDASLYEDLGFDSLSMIHLQILVEELTGELLTYEVLPVVNTVGDAYDMYLQILVDQVSPG